MSRLVVLDSGVLGLLTHPHRSTESQRCNDWLERLVQMGDDVRLPEIVDYEVRREYLRRNSTRGLYYLDGLSQPPRYVPLTTEAMRRAAMLWAWARNHGHITAPGFDLNADLILAAQAQLLVPLSTLPLIATTNIRHLAPFADARLWTAI